MAASLDPTKNPILQVYQFFTQPGLKRVDKAEFFGFRNLKLRTITGAKAQELIKLLRTTQDAVNHFRLILDNQRLIDFSPVSVTEWFDRETIEHLSDQLCADCMGALSSLRDDLDAYQAGAPLAEDDLVEGVLGVLALLADCRSCGDRFEFDVKLDKSVLAKEYLLGGPANVKENVSSLLWYDSESFRKAFDSFNSFLSFTLQKAEKPIVVFLYESANSYHGDFFKIFSLTDSTAPLSRREQDLAEQLGAITTQILDDYKVLRLRHSNERRPQERLDLPPSLFLQRKEELAQYPPHSLFTDGPLRSVLIYAIMAWLTEKCRLDAAVGHFTLPSDYASQPDLELMFSLIDVQREAGSIFDTQSDWRAISGLVVREIGQSAGNEQLRGYWNKALKSRSTTDFSSSQFFKTLEGVYRDFIGLKQAPPSVTASAPEFIDILIFLDAESKEIKFQLNSVSLGYVYESVGEVSLGKGDPDLLAVELSKLAREHRSRILVPDKTNPEVRVPSVDRLRAHGVELWRKLIPNDLKRAYEKLRNEKDLTIFIVSDDPSFPWELVRPVELKGKISTTGFADLWWAVQFSIGRWLRNSPASPAKTVAVNRICCIATAAQLAAAAKEQVYLKKTGTICDLPQSFDELISFLRTRDYDLIHFACHGQFHTGDPGDSVLVLPDGKLLRPIDFSDEEIMLKFSENQPLVFLNSCHSGRTGPTLIGIEGWAERFIDLRAGAFIGCGWEVDDLLAANFAIAFYDAFKGGMSMGKAVHEARRKISEQDEKNSTWLAYYLYGNPNCVIRNES